MVSVVDFVRETLTNPQNFPPAAGRRSLGRRSVGVSESDDDEGGATEHKLGCGRPNLCTDKPAGSAPESVGMSVPELAGLLVSA